MNVSTLFLKLTLITSLSFLSIILNPALAEPSNQAQFRGVYYGALPCEDCPGIATTLSLKNKNNYLLVTQKAEVSTREYYEKGKYEWDEKAELVTLTSRKKSIVRELQIKNDKTLILLSVDGVKLENDPKKLTMTKREKTESSSGNHGAH